MQRINLPPASTNEFAGEVLTLLENFNGVHPVDARKTRAGSVCADLVSRRTHSMAKRVPASMRSRQQLSDLIEGRLSSLAGSAELIKPR